MDEISPTEKPLDQDILDTKGRLFRLVLAIAISAVFTGLCMNFMLHDGNGPEGSLGSASAGIVGILMLILVAHVSHKVIVRVHEKRRATRR
ncbi:MAG TPA: hypothetical protein VGM90_26765 [Kofleriaceae bacterium]|jgi:hypothetical protein